MSVPKHYWEGNSSPTENLDICTRRVSGINLISYAHSQNIRNQIILMLWEQENQKA